MLSLGDNTFKGHQNIFQDNTKDVIHRNLAMKNDYGKVWKTNLLEVLATLVEFTSMQVWDDAAEIGVTPPMLLWLMIWFMLLMGRIIWYLMKKFNSKGASGKDTAFMYVFQVMHMSDTSVRDTHPKLTGTFTLRAPWKYCGPA